MVESSPPSEFAEAAAQYERHAIELAEAAQRIRPELFRDARRDAVALATACDNNMRATAVQIVQDWLEPNGRANARTYVLVDEMLLMAAQFAVFPFRALRIPLDRFPDLGIDDDGTRESRLLNVAASLVAATVRGEGRSGQLVLAAHLNAEQPPTAVMEFVLSVVVVTRATAGLAGHVQGRTPGQMLTQAGLVAA